MEINKQTITGFIHAEKNSWDNEISYHFFTTDMSQYGYILLQTHSFEVNINPCDLNALVIKNLKEKKETLQAETYVKIKMIDDQIQQLLSIENKS